MFSHHIFPVIVAYFPVVVCLRWLYHNKLSFSYISRESWVLYILLLCSLIVCAINRVHYVSLVVFVCLHIALRNYHHYGDVSEGIELLKRLSGIFCRVCVWDQVNFHNNCHAIYGAMCIQLTNFSYDVRIRVLYQIIIIKSEVWPTCHCLGTSHETMASAICLSIFLKSQKYSRESLERFKQKCAICSNCKLWVVNKHIEVNVLYSPGYYNQGIWYYFHQQCYL